ncbi:MAG: hypothetical protein ACR2GR_06850 [Rhodothermales bacterium]
MAWIRVRGIVVQGHRVASAQTRDPRFPGGTVAMQTPLFSQAGLDLSPYHAGTLNVSIAPQRYAVIQAKHTFRNVKWAATEPAEDFSFFDCRVHSAGRVYSGLIYYPHPETKPEHDQPPDVLEVLAPFISDVGYGDALVLELDPAQIWVGGER